VGRPEAWDLAIDMVRKADVNFFGGCASGTKVQLDTNRLHYSEVTLKARSITRRRRCAGIQADCGEKIRSNDYITGKRRSLSRLQQVLRHMLNRQRRHQDRHYSRALEQSRTGGRRSRLNDIPPLRLNG